MFYYLYVLFFVLLLFTSYSVLENHTVQNNTKLNFQKQVRRSWENNPDKHPHRMAHYGSFAFRIQHKLSLFDSGLENFTGNVVFLEAHKQNTVNFSEANLSTGLLRFGEISLSILLRFIVPLILFFLGFSAIASDRENGTLKILFAQGIGWKQLIFGKTFGLFLIALLFFIPTLVTTFFLANTTAISSDELNRIFFIAFFFLFFFWIVSLGTVLVSVISPTSKSALLKLLGLWLFLVILLPKTMQAFGNYVYETPTKNEFEEQIEKDLILLGDSHNPDDLHYNKIKDSLLLQFKVDSVQKLPFNYGGFVMKEGERLSAEIYNNHQKKLFQLYQKQNDLNKFTAIVNPFTAIKNISMSLSGTDFESYTDFQNQAERYRYNLAQRMNELQIKHISNKKLGEKDKPHSISNKYWKETPDFTNRFLTLKTVLENIQFEIITLLFWAFGLIVLIHLIEKKLKVI